MSLEEGCNVIFLAGRLCVGFVFCGSYSQVILLHPGGLMHFFGGAMGSGENISGRIPNLTHGFSSVGKWPVQMVAATWCLLFYRGLGQDLEWNPHVNVSLPRCFGRRQLGVHGLSPNSVAASLRGRDRKPGFWKAMAMPWSARCRWQVSHRKSLNFPNIATAFSSFPAFHA